MSSRRITRWGSLLALLLLLLAAPFLLDDFWLQAGLFIMAWAVAAVGLTLLVGVAGQLSLGNAFFAAAGAYMYAWLSGPTDGPQVGLGLPAAVAAVAAIATAALLGALFSPISGRVRGIYLGLATLGLVFLGQYLLLNLTDITGGFLGRSAEPFEIFGFSLGDSDPDYLTVLGVRFGTLQRHWYLFAVVAVIAVWIASNIKRGRTGRAFVNVRDSETAAASLGINVARTKAMAFIVSSAFAGTSGVLLALAYGRVAPEVFGLQVSIDVLVMVVLGRLGSVQGAVAGAAFVVGVPILLVQYSASLPLIAEPGMQGLDGSTAARLLYGLALILMLIFVREDALGSLPRLLSRSGQPARQTTASLDARTEQTQPPAAQDAVGNASKENSL